MISVNNYIEEKADRLLIESKCFSVPVKVESITKYLKIELQALEIEDEVSGFCVLKGNSVHIGYNKHHPVKRQRFTIAHEIGHYWLHAKHTPIFIDKTFNRNSVSSTGKSVIEKEANNFAAALLMPKKLLIEEIARIDDEGSIYEQDKFISHLASIFNVSNHAMTIRLTNLDLIDYSEYA